MIILRILSHQLNIAFFEHRNSDNICAVCWEQVTVNPPSIDLFNEAPFPTDAAIFPPEVYVDKFDVSHSVSPGRPQEMAHWIQDQVDTFIQEKGGGDR